MITNVTGQFNAINGEIEAADASFGGARVQFTADLNSINTGNEQRDGHLKSPEFFDTEKFPTLQFESTHYNAGEGKITGNLTIRDVTKVVTLDAEFGGTNKDPWGNEKAGFSVSGKINRADFGLTWNAALETGGVMVSEDVKLNAELQFVKPA